jgi:predicted transcriptional regulator
MQIVELRDLLEAEVLCGEDQLEEEISTVFASDMMSDVLACPDELHCLLTGLINGQVIRTADMMDIGLIVFVRGKYPPSDVVEMARQRDMVVLVTKYRMFSACGRLYEAGLGRGET